MKPKNTLTIHLCWAVACGAAVFVGYLGRSPKAVSKTADAHLTLKVTSSPELETADFEESDRSKKRNEKSAVREIFDLKKMGSADWKALAQQSTRDPNPIARRLAFSQLLEALTAENAVAIREQLVAAGAEGDEWRDFNFSWGALAGKEAFDFADKSEERDLDAVMAGWASASPAAAIALLENLPEGMKGNRDRLAESVVTGIAGADRELATDLVLRLAGPKGDEQSEKLINIVAREALRGGDVKAAASWSDSLPDGALKGAAMQQIADDFVKANPEEAAAWAARYADQDFAARAVEEVGGEWAKRNPVAAVTWLQELPEGNGQAAGLSSAFGDWEDRDPSAAAEHLYSMTNSPQRDAAISGFARGYAWQDPLTAIAWALDIGDPNLRNESITRAGQVFYRRDPEGAQAWLESSAIQPEIKEAVLNPPRRR
jgi:hypothetical protein